MSTRAEVSALLAQTEWIRALARGLAADVHLAEDLVQDAWVAALERPPRDDRPLRGWLATVLRNRWRDLGRERGWRERRERAAARDEALPSAHELVERAAVQRTLVEAVLELEEPYRSTVLLRFFEGLPQREIARRTSTSVATVNSRLTRALERLRERLARGGGRTAWLQALAPLLRQPSLAPVAALGVPAMKIVAAVVVVSLVVGWALWRSSPERERPAEAVTRVAVAEPERSPSGDAEHTRASAPPADEETSPTERAPVSAPVAKTETEPAPTPPATLTGPRTVRGRVLDASGNGVAGLELVLGTKSGDLAHSSVRCTSGAGGWFEIGLEAAAETIVVADARYATVMAGVVRELGETRPLVVVAPRIAVGGFVVDETGQPIAGADVELRLPSSFGIEWGLALDYALALRWRARTDANGAYALADVPALDAAALSAALGGYEAHSEPAPQASDPAHVIVLARPLAKDGLVRGVVLDEAGAFVEGARVAARGDSTLSDRQGAFTLDVRETGAEPPLRAAKRGHLPAVFEPERGADGAPRWPAWIVLRLGGPPARLEGRVVDAAGDPVAGAWVWLDDTTPFGQIGELVLATESLARGDERFWSYEVTAADGTFAIDGLLAREYRVQALDPRNLLSVESPGLSAADSPVELVLPTHDLHERVAGRVVSQRGQPVPGALVQLFRTTYVVPLSGGGRVADAAQAQKQVTGDDGTFVFTDVPGDASILVTGDAILFDGTELEREDDVEAIAIVVRLRLQMQVELDEPITRADGFRVLDAAGEPMVLTVMRGDGPTYGPWMPILAGRSAVISLDEEATTLVLLHGEDVVARVALNLAAGAPNVVRP